eukprot:Platyproteum_vivax@DN5086_c0_g1_i1.p1
MDRVQLKLGSTGSLFLGIVLTIVSASICILGSNLQKLSNTLELVKCKEQERPRRTEWLQPVWLSGSLLYLFSNIVHIAALAFAPASVLTPMNSVSLAVNCAIAPCLHGEKFGWAEFLSTSCILIGVSLCTIASIGPSASRDDSTPPSHSWIDPWYMTYLIVLLLSIILCYGLILHRERQLMDATVSIVRRQSMEEVQEPLNKQGGDLLKFQSDRFLGLAYGVLSGLIGSQTVLEAKEFGSIVQSLVRDLNELRNPMLYLSAFFFIFSSIAQIYYLNQALYRHDALLVIPAYYIVWTIFGVLGGFAKFHEIKGFSVHQLLLFVAGLAVALGGIYFLAGYEVESLEHIESDIQEFEQEPSTEAAQVEEPVAQGPANYLPLPFIPYNLQYRQMHDKVQEKRNTRRLFRAYSDPDELEMGKIDRSPIGAEDHDKTTRYFSKFESVYPMSRPAIAKDVMKAAHVRIPSPLPPGTGKNAGKYTPVNQRDPLLK